MFPYGFLITLLYIAFKSLWPLKNSLNIKPIPTAHLKFKRKFFQKEIEKLSIFKTRSKRSPPIPLCIQKRDVPWEKVPFVPRPSLIADPITAFGKKKSLFPEDEHKRRASSSSIIQQIKAETKAKPLSQLRPLDAYKSPRDQTRDRVSNEIHRQQRLRDSGGLTSYFTDSQSMDLILPRIHGSSSSRLTPREFRGPIY